jgi:hypothetical protein
VALIVSSDGLRNPAPAPLKRYAGAALLAQNGEILLFVMRRARPIPKNSQKLYAIVTGRGAKILLASVSSFRGYCGPTSRALVVGNAPARCSNESPWRRVAVV